MKSGFCRSIRSFKYQRLEKPGKATTIEPASEEHMQKLQKIVESLGLEAVIGG